MSFSWARKGREGPLGKERQSRSGDSDDVVF
jgi:hypothetical protein